VEAEAKSKGRSEAGPPNVCRNAGYRVAVAPQIEVHYFAFHRHVPRQARTALTIERLDANAGYRGHNAPPDYKFKIYTSKQKRRVTPAIKREMRRRAAVEPVIGHLKEDHRMDRNYLAHRQGDLNNAVLAAASYNFRRLIKWLRILLRLFLAMLFAPPNTRAA
jgi:IS5 family transposase